jgi:prophage DNA circulation protein
MASSNPTQGSAPVTLGSFQFSGFSTPPSIKFGGRQQLVVHKMPGGRRVIQDMGSDPANIVISCMFLGNGGNAQAQQLVRMKDTGGLYRLIWSTNSYTVAIEDVELTGEYSKIECTITCVVQTTQPSTNVATPVQSVASDIGSANTNNLDDSLGPPLAAATSALSAPGSVITDALGALQTAQSTAASIIGQANANLGALGLVGLPGVNTSVTLRGLSVVTSSLSNIVNVGPSNAYIGRAIQTITAAL